MPLYEPNVPTRYTAPLLDYLRSDRSPWLNAALKEAGIDAGLIHQPEAALTIAQFDALITALGRHSHRTDLGFEMGRRITRDTHGALGQAMARCANVEEMLRLAARYSRLMSPSFSLQFKRKPKQGELIWRPAAGMSAETLKTFYEIHVVSLYIILHDALGERLLPYDSYLPMRRPAHADHYREFSKLRVHFVEQPLPEVRTVLDAALLDEPLRPRRDGVVISSDELMQLQGNVGKAQRWSDWVRLMLREADAHQPTQAQLAELLNMSAHTLARHLAHEQCSYRELATEIRHQRACVLLAENRYSISQIAHRLGYRDAANFSHAFRKMRGCSPRAHRASTSR